MPGNEVRSVLGAMIHRRLKQQYSLLPIFSFLDPPPRRKGGSGEYSTSSHYGLAVAMDSAKTQAFEVSCWAARVYAKEVCKGVMS